MTGDPHPIVKRSCDRIRKHRKAIQEAQKQLREAVRAAERECTSEEVLGL